MNNRPIRRKLKDNPYELIINNDSYLIKFIDGNKRIQELEVSLDVFNVFNRSELKDLSQMNEYDNHIEHLDVCENDLHKRKFIKEKTVQEIVEDNITYEELRKAINTLSSVQKRRIKMYYFEDMTLEEIAKLENTTHQAISKSIKSSIENLKKFLKN